MRSNLPPERSRVLFDSSNDERVKLIAEMDEMANRMMNDPKLQEELTPAYNELSRRLDRAAEAARLNRTRQN